MSSSGILVLNFARKPLAKIWLQAPVDRLGVKGTGWPRVPATIGYPPNFGAWPLPYPPGNAVLTTGYRLPVFVPGTRVPGNIVAFVLV